MPRLKTRPNFLILLTDEHGAQFSGTYGHAAIRTPNMDRLACEGVTFDAAYCNAPLCVPSRGCFMTGQYNFNNKIWDNAVPLRNDCVTWPYLLRSIGYDAVLSGKMHLVGLDHLHGFRAQLSRDIHAELVHDIHLWDEGIPRASRPWRGVYETGTALPGGRERPHSVPTGAGRTVEIEVDDESIQAAVEYLREPARHEQPFALCVGLIAPHFPFVVPEPFFSQYYPDHADMPDMPEGHLESLPPAAQRLRRQLGLWGHTEDQVKRARAAYYGLVSYMDDKLGRLMNALEESGLAENTVIIHTSDHGEMLGEHGLWRKMCFYEQSARVPLQFRWPGMLPEDRRIDECASLIDVTATILELAGMSKDEQKQHWGIDGDGLYALMRGDDADWKDEAFSEQNAHGTDRPRAMLRKGPWKLSLSHGSPLEMELYNLDSDPGEFHNLAEEASCAQMRDRLLKRIITRWDGETLAGEIKTSQRERVLIRNVEPNIVRF